MLVVCIYVQSISEDPLEELSKKTPDVGVSKAPPEELLRAVPSAGFRHKLNKLQLRASQSAGVSQNFRLYFAFKILCGYLCVL